MKELDRLTAEVERLKIDNHRHCASLTTTAMWESAIAELRELRVRCEALESDKRNASAIPEGSMLITIEPTENEIDAPRSFLMGLELGLKSLEEMRKHMTRVGDSIDSWPIWAKNETGHITKAGKAVIIRAMMIAAVAR